MDTGKLNSIIFCVTVCVAIISISTCSAIVGWQPPIHKCGKVGE